MSPQEFVAKWKQANLSERSACQQHFLDLCDVLGQPKPAAADPPGAFYTFERVVSKTGGGKGWADVWFRGHFGLDRFIARSMVGKHHFFTWLPAEVLAANLVIVVATDESWSFGIVNSRIHEAWALTLGTRLETRPRYTPTTCFETFPFPEASANQLATIGDAAKQLDQLRCAWLNPPEWTHDEILTFPGSVDGPWARYVENPNSRSVGTVRYRRLVPNDEDCAKQLAKRTLTNLYNQRPAWLDHAHRRLDEAVFAAYGWPTDLTDDDILARLLELNLARAPAQ